MWEGPRHIRTRAHPPRRHAQRMTVKRHLKAHPAPHPVMLTHVRVNPRRVHTQDVAERGARNSAVVRSRLGGRRSDCRSTVERSEVVVVMKVMGQRRASELND